MVAVAPKETRAALRIDIANFAPKVWPHALAFRIWRNTSMDSRDWQVRFVHIRCRIFLFEIILVSLGCLPVVHAQDPAVPLWLCWSQECWCWRLV